MVNHGDETHITSIRVFKANQVPSSAQEEGLFFFHVMTKIATLVTHNGLIEEEIKPAEQIKEKAVPFNPRRLCSEEHIQKLAEITVIRSGLFVPANYELFSREISKYLSTFRFYVNSADPSVMTSRIRILVRVHRTRVAEYTRNFYKWFSKRAISYVEQESCFDDEDEDEDEDEDKLLGNEELMDFCASLKKEARLSSALVEVGDELLEGFREIFGVMVMESTTDEENCWCSICLEGFLMGMEVVKAPNCFHLFHRSCLVKWLVKSNTCPMCRGSCLVVV